MSSTTNSEQADRSTGQDGQSRQASDGSSTQPTADARNPHLETLDCIDARMVELDLLEQWINQGGGNLVKFKLHRLANLEERRKKLVGGSSADHTQSIEHNAPGSETNTDTTSLPKAPPVDSITLDTELDYILDDISDYWLNPERYSAPMKKGEKTFRQTILDWHTKELLAQEHIFTPNPGSTSMKCSCGNVYSGSSEQQQHIDYQIKLQAQAIQAREEQ